MEPLDFLNDAPQGGDQPPVVETPQEAGQARDASGRFASSEPASPAQPPSEPAPAAQPEAKTEPPPGYVPAGVVKELRDEIRSLKAQPTPQAPAEPQEQPYIDPDVQSALLSERLNISEDLAVDKYGQETVDAAKAWAVEKFKTNPAYQAEVLAQRNPYRRVVEDHKRDQALQTIGGDFDAQKWAQFQAWQAAQANGQAPAEQAAAPAAAIPSPPPPPQSLASATSAGGPAMVPTGPGQAFANAIK